MGLPEGYSDAVEKIKAESLQARGYRRHTLIGNSISVFVLVFVAQSIIGKASVPSTEANEWSIPVGYEGIFQEALEECPYFLDRKLVVCAVTACLVLRLANSMHMPRIVGGKIPKQANCRQEHASQVSTNWIEPFRAMRGCTRCRVATLQRTLDSRRPGLCSQDDRQLTRGN